MGYDRQSGSSGAVVAILAVAAILVFVVILLAGGAFFFVRTSTMEQTAIVEMERAMMAEARAQEMRVLAEKQRELALPEATPVDEAGDSASMSVDAPTAEPLTVTLDKDGNARLAGEPVTMDALVIALGNSDKSAAPSVVIRVDAQCVFEHVAAVMSACRQAGVTNYRVESN